MVIKRSLMGTAWASKINLPVWILIFFSFSITLTKTTSATTTTKINHQASVLSELEDFIEDVDGLVRLAVVDLRQDLVESNECSGSANSGWAVNKNVGWSWNKFATVFNTLGLEIHKFIFVYSGEQMRFKSFQIESWLNESFPNFRASI